jgi:hypothetical protein
MAEHTTIQFQDVSLAEARRMGRGPRMDPQLYHMLRGKIQSLDNTATRMTRSEGTSPTTMKHRMLRVAAELNIPVTFRRVAGGLLFWRSTEEDLQQTKPVAERLHAARQPCQPTRRARRRRTESAMISQRHPRLSPYGRLEVDHGRRQMGRIWIPIWPI